MIKRQTNPKFRTYLDLAHDEPLGVESENPRAGVEAEDEDEE